MISFTHQKLRTPLPRGNAQVKGYPSECWAGFHLYRAVLVGIWWQNKQTRVLEFEDNFVIISVSICKWENSEPERLGNLCQVEENQWQYRDPKSTNSQLGVLSNMSPRVLEIALILPSSYNLPHNFQPLASALKTTFNSWNTEAISSLLCLLGDRI